jgi:putative sporulation protein YtaF
MISGFLSKQVASIIAMLLLTMIGLWMIVEPYAAKTRDSAGDSEKEEGKSIFRIMMKPEYADKDHSKHIDFKEATLLGVALSINNVGGGLSAGMIGLSPFWVGLLSAVLNFLALWAGNYIAAIFTAWNLSQKATVVAGIILIAIGIEQII